MVSGPRVERAQTDGSSVLPSPSRPGPDPDDHSVVFRCFFVDFPFDGLFVSNLILLRSFAVPRISQLLDSTGTFYAGGSARARGLARALAVLVGHGYDS